MHSVHHWSFCVHIRYSSPLFCYLFWSPILHSFDTIRGDHCSFHYIHSTFIHSLPTPTIHSTSHSPFLFDHSIHSPDLLFGDYDTGIDTFILIILTLFCLFQNGVDDAFCCPVHCWWWWYSFIYFCYSWYIHLFIDSIHWYRWWYIQWCSFIVPVLLMVFDIPILPFIHSTIPDTFDDDTFICLFILIHLHYLTWYLLFDTFCSVLVMMMILIPFIVLFPFWSTCLIVPFPTFLMTVTYLPLHSTPFYNCWLTFYLHYMPFYLRYRLPDSVHVHSFSLHLFITLLFLTVDHHSIVPYHLFYILLFTIFFVLPLLVVFRC